MASNAFAFLMRLGARDAETHTRFTRGESIGLAFDTLAGFASTIAATIILIVIFVRLHRNGWSSWEALDVSVVSLFMAELIQGIAHAMDLKWVIDGGADTGSFCTTQGLLQQLGETSVALATLTIAIQTFLTIWWLKYLNRTICFFVTLFEFIFIALFVGIGFGIHTKPSKEYYSVPTPYWCWIGKSYSRERIGGEYLWFWVTLFGSMLLYIPLFLLHRGTIKPGTRWYSPKADFIATQSSEVEETHGDHRAASPDSAHSTDNQKSRDVLDSPEVLSRGKLQIWSTILYPVLYCVVVLPLSVVRFIGFHEEAKSGQSHISPVATFIVAIVFTLSGVFNALLYPLTRAKFFQSEEKTALSGPAFRMGEMAERSSMHSTAASVTV